MSDYVGAYRLKKVDIKGQDGKEADITKLVLEINVNAYVTQPTYTIVVTVRDNRNLINKLPLRGGQNINIEIEYGNEIKTWNAVIGSINDIENAVNIFKENDCPFELMHCVSTYPMKPEDANLNTIVALKEKFNCNVGYSGHENGVVVSLAATFYGLS